MDCLTKAEAEERLRFAPEDNKFCPDCLTELREIMDTDSNIPVLYCPNETCLNDDQYDRHGNSFS